MTNRDRRYTKSNSRMNKPNRMNTILNILIGIVVVLIIFTAGLIFIKKDDTQNINENLPSEALHSEDESELTDETVASSEEEQIDSEEIEPEEENTEATEQNAVTSDESINDNSTSGGTVSSAPSDDPLVSESIVNTSWKPIGTSQTGQHTSVYKEGHIDWDEKVKALSYTTGLSSDNMIVWRIENGGSPQQSIGVVSSNNKEEKYRVYLKWIDGEGWKPEKMETLKTLNGAY